MQTTIRTYRLKELYAMYGAGKTYRTFQRHKEDYVEVHSHTGGKIQKRYLDKKDSAFMKAIKDLIS